MKKIVILWNNCNSLWQASTPGAILIQPSLTHMKHRTVLPLLPGFHYIAGEIITSDISCHISNDWKSIKLTLSAAHQYIHTQCTHTHVLTKACSCRVTQSCLPSKAHFKNTVEDRAINSKEGCRCHTM